MSRHPSTTLDGPEAAAREPGPIGDRTGPSSVEISLRWGDVDSYGHVNNCEVVRIIEEARMRWLMSTGAFDEETAVVAAHEIGYLRPLRYSLDPVRSEEHTSELQSP